MTRAHQAHHAAWKPIQDAAIEVAGFASALHSAALQARLGRDPEGAKFAALAARLPAQDQSRLWERVREQRAGAGRAA